MSDNPFSSYSTRHNFGFLLRYYRQNLGWSQPEMARQMKNLGFFITPSALNKYELGQRRPSGDFIAMLEVVFGLSEDATTGFLQALATDYLMELLDEYSHTKRKAI